MAEKSRKIPTRAKAAHLCFPQLRAAGKVPSPATLLERLREAVFRYIMICALSKATTSHHHHHAAGAGAGFPDDVVRRRHSYQNADHHHSEAVADCIEFIKKKAYSDDEIVHDGGSMDAEADVAVPEPAGVWLTSGGARD